MATRRKAAAPRFQAPTAADQASQPPPVPGFVAPPAPDQLAIQQAQIAGKQAIVDRLVLPGRHLGMGGAEITPDNPLGSSGPSPFAPVNEKYGANPYARTNAERAAVAADFGTPGLVPGAPGIPPRNDVNNPYGAGVISSAPVPSSPGPATAPFLAPSGAGFEGMINPALPDGQKFADSNFFRIDPTTLPPGVVASDGTTQYRRLQQPFIAPMSFGAPQNPPRVFRR